MILLSLRGFLTYQVGFLGWVILLGLGIPINSTRERNILLLEFYNLGFVSKNPESS